MKIHEYQAKELLGRHGVAIQKGRIAFSAADVKQIVDELQLQQIVLKAQIHAGGRGKAGGIKMAKGAAEAFSLAEKMFGMKLVTPQTGAEGRIVKRILVTEAADIKKELYAGLILDRAKSELVFMISTEGGVEIEEVAKENPDAIHKFVIDPDLGMTDFLARKIAFKLFTDMNLVKQAVSLFKKLYQIFIDTDASLVEINPLVITDDGRLLALDGKMNFDDNALYRQPDIEVLNEPSEDEKKEIAAKESGLTYIRLDGNIGCMVNGAGLAMATMDIIKHFGGSPANFLDIGGSSSPQKVIDAMTLLMSDKNVKVIMINIFGGITRCDDVAKGIVIALDQMKLDIPIVIRLSGTNAEEGLKIIKEKNLPTVRSLSEAAQEAIRLIS